MQYTSDVPTIGSADPDAQNPQPLHEQNGATRHPLSLHFSDVLPLRRGSLNESARDGALGRWRRCCRRSSPVALGLGTRICEEPREAALALAREIAGRSPDAIRAAKQLLDRTGDLSVADGLRLEEKLQRSVIGKPNQIEAVRANAEKRAPRFRDPGSDGSR